MRFPLAAMICAALCLPIAAVAAGASAKPSLIAEAVSDPARPQADRATDENRKPADTIAFAGVKPGMVVGEFFPGGGYFTRMISHVVGPSGHVYGIENTGWKGAVKAAETVAATLPNVS